VDGNLQWWALALCVAVPFLLLGGLLLLARLEAWVEAPEQRAAAVADLIANVDETGELEVAVAHLLDEATRRRPVRRGATRLPAGATRSPVADPRRTPTPRPRQPADPVPHRD
jgi:hypothetical protein